MTRIPAPGFTAIMRPLAGGLLVAALALLPSSASATPITFTTTGTASGNPVSGQATFDFGPTSFTITLENLLDPTEFISQMLDGLSFRLLGGSGNTSITGATAAGILQCGGDNLAPCDPYVGPVPTNYGWLTSTSGTITTIAPNGYKPFGIIDTSYSLPSNGNGGVANPSHNPLLVGPVIFTMSGGYTGVSDVTFFWGTVPDRTTGTCTNCGGGGGNDPLTPVPEPGTLILLGSGLVAAAHRARRTKS